MSLKNIKARIQIRDVMSRSPVTVGPRVSVTKVSRLMKERGIGSVLVTADGSPLGIATERDLVLRVLAENRDPDKTPVKEIMTSPLITVTPDTDVVEALRKMATLDVRRLVIVDKGQLSGVVTEKDILRVAPELMEVLFETAAMRREEAFKGEELAGYCDRCEEWSDSLMEKDGEFICQDCYTYEREHMPEEGEEPVR